eukprot:gene3941-19845_t
MVGVTKLSAAKAYELAKPWRAHVPVARGKTRFMDFAEEVEAVLWRDERVVELWRAADADDPIRR